MPHRDDNDIIAHTHNTARFFTEKRQISWVLLIAVFAWGAYGWMNMPKRKDPDIPVLIALATCPWPGADAAKVEQLVTKPMEETIAQNSYLHEPDAGNEFAIKSMSLPGMAVVQVQLSEDLKDTTQQFNDINLRLDYLNNNLPKGAGPIKFNSGFGNTAAMMLTVASPKESGVEIAVRARNINKAIESVRSEFPAEARKRMTFVVALPGSIDAASLGTVFDMLSASLAEGGMAKDPRVVSAPGFIALDAEVTASPGDFLAYTKRFSVEMLGLPGFHVDSWEPVLIGNTAETEKKLEAVAGDKYSYSDLENVTELITEVLQSVDEVSIIERSGVLPQRVYLDYSQVELASYGILPADIKKAVNARNTDLPGGELDIGGTEVIVYPSGEFTNPSQIGGVVISRTPDGVPVYLRDLFGITRGYQDPPTFLNFYSRRDENGKWQRSRAVTLAVQMRKGDQIAKFGEALDIAKAELRHIIPSDLIIAKTSDQPEQVEDNMDLFMEALVEAIILVVLVAWFGFREWRSALLMAFSIPITLSMTFGLMYFLGIDLQQVSIATLIIALGLLVDDPVVANDAIKSNLAIGHPPEVASWLGPTKLARAIMFATVTNIVAYLPYLMLTGTTGEFLYSLPVVMACALVSSRLVSMTFIPFLGFYLLRPGKKPEETIEEKRSTGFYGFYHMVGKYAIEHRKKVLAFSLAFFILGGIVGSRLASSFFPEDIEYLSYIDVWLPNGVSLSQTNDVAARAEEVIRETARSYGEKEKKKGEVLESVTSFIGGGGPRFWYTLSPQQQQTNYAQIVLRVSDKDDTPALAPVIQKALSGTIPGAYFEVRQLQLNPVDYPVQIHISGRSDISTDLVSEAENIRTLRRLAEELKDILRKVPETMSVRDDWFEDSFRVRLEVDPDRANLSGITNEDVAVSSAAGLSGAEVTVYQEGDKQIPVLARLRIDERAELSDLQSLYVYASDNEQKIPLLEVSSVNYGMEVSRIMRREHFKTISVIGFPEPGQYPSTILAKAEKEIDAFIDNLPPGYQLVYGGEKAKQIQGFRNLTTVLIISVLAIFLALVLQFNNAIKPFLVFAAVPYGVVGSLAALFIMREAFGFMAFLGIASLVGVIVSHVIVLFDFIEVKHEEGEPFEDSLLDAGIERLRPVLITVGATILALFPLAIHGGPLWQPLCYAQIGGLALATVIELVLVPVFYAVFVLDLKIIKWGNN
jgi:multidrug efflux pump subunit AcrB